MDRRREALEGNDERGDAPFPARQYPSSSALSSVAAPHSPSLLTPPRHFSFRRMREPRDAPPGCSRAVPRACAVPAVTERGGAGRAPAALREGAGSVRVRRRAAGDAARARRGRRRARGGARVAGARGRPLVGPSVRPGVRGPAGSGPQPSLPGHACRPLPPRHRGRDARSRQDEAGEEGPGEG